MMYADPGSRPPRPRPHLRFPFQKSRRLTKRHQLLSSLLFIVVLSGVIAGWSTGVFITHAAAPLSSAPSNMTIDQFLKEGHQDNTYRIRFGEPSLLRLARNGHIAPTTSLTRLWEAGSPLP